LRPRKRELPREASPTRHPRSRRPPLDLKAIDKPVNVLMDLEPRNPDTVGIPGRVLDGHSIVGPTLGKAMAEGKPVASDPVPLLRINGPLGIVLAAPCLQRAREPAGFVTFSYETRAADARQ
jgi:hypothetical protein